jgi:hypothetical protein
MLTARGEARRTWLELANGGCRLRFPTSSTGRSCSRTGSLRGGFTQQATFRIIERDRGRHPRKLTEQLARYRALDAPA